MSTVRITLPDASVKEVPLGTTGLELARQIGPGLARAALAIRVNGQVRDLARPLEVDATVSILTERDETATKEMEEEFVLGETIEAPVVVRRRPTTKFKTLREFALSALQLTQQEQESGAVQALMGGYSSYSGQQTRGNTRRRLREVRPAPRRTDW